MFLALCSATCEMVMVCLDEWPVDQHEESFWLQRTCGSSRSGGSCFQDMIRSSLPEEVFLYHIHDLNMSKELC